MAKLLAAAVRSEIMNHLAAAPTSPGFDVFGLRAVTAAMGTRSKPTVSRAVHRLVERGLLESMTPTGTRFRPDVDGWQGPVRYVRRTAGS